jgi:hypothetical protein
MNIDEIDLKCSVPWPGKLHPVVRSDISGSILLIITKAIHTTITKFPPFNLVQVLNLHFRRRLPFAFISNVTNA